jgi:histidyl-tRNA synthetase
LIVGEDEAATDSVAVRDLRGDAEQERVQRANLIDRVRSLLS